MPLPWALDELKHRYFIKNFTIKCTDVTKSAASHLEMEKSCRNRNRSMTRPGIKAIFVQSFIEIGKVVFA